MNHGAQLLGKQISERGEQNKLAAELGIDQGHLSRISRGEKLPGLGTRRKLFERFRIPVLSWDDPPEQEQQEDPPNAA